MSGPSRLHVVVLTGAGMSAESGLATFRGMNGLWENHRIEEVASPDAWKSNPAMVLRFYNERRKQMRSCEPNAGHRGLAAWERNFRVSIITQNVDDLHERAGSTQILHLHGELTKARSSVDPALVYDIEGWELKSESRCARGSPLRPHIVWFGEPVPRFADAVALTEAADVFVVIGTSLSVYPAASLLEFTPPGIPRFLVDPHPPATLPPGVNVIALGATAGVPVLTNELQRLRSARGDARPDDGPRRSHPS